MKTTIDIGEFVNVSWQRAVLPLLGLCCGLAAAQAVTPALPARYEADASILVVANPPDGDRPAEMSLALAQNLAPTVAKLVGSREVALDAADALSLPEQAVAGHVRGSFEPGLQIITVRATAPSAERAAAIANAASQAVGGQLTRLKIGGDTRVTTRVVDTASPPSRPAFPKPLLNVALGALAGLLLGWGATMLRDRFARGLRDVAQIESRLGLPVVGVLPPMPRRFARHHAAALFARRDVARHTRAAAAALSVLTATSERRRLLVASVRDDDGASLITALLGLGMAAERRPITLVDGAVRDPALAGHFPDAPFTWQQVVNDRRTPARLASAPTLMVLPTEPQDGLGPTHARALGEVLDLLDDGDESVVVHGSPVLASCDTAALTRHVDGVLLVVVAGQTKLTEAERAARLLRRLGMPLIGVIAVGATDGGACGPAETVAGAGPAVAPAPASGDGGGGEPQSRAPQAVRPPADARPLVAATGAGTPAEPVGVRAHGPQHSAVGRPLARAEGGLRPARAAAGRVPIEGVPARRTLDPDATRYLPNGVVVDTDPAPRAQPKTRPWSSRRRP
ncbi:hypothetical protein [Micromonospora sp. NPDC047074]|uniref:hypothetical protein n=1 Tax=Micromonospora sp. NPDC047074 TaxID=3154339 RepID=UPI0033FE57D8